LLPLDDKALRRLWWLGIHTLGDFARLPKGAMLAQFGKQGPIAHQLAQGIDPTPVRKYAQERELQRSISFDGLVSDRQVVSHALNQLTTELVKALEKSAETARKVRLTLVLDRNGACEFEARLRRRTGTAPQLENTLQGLLDRAQINAPIREIEVTFGDMVPRAPQQLELFPAMRLVESRQAVLDDLVHRYGERFFTASIANEHTLFHRVHCQ
jgi:nucleotidyltransferase/DNA polymerase involved in DNA repair